jgi:hypothetical protein
MTSASPVDSVAIDNVGDLAVVSTSPVLQRRALHPDADLGVLPVFGDARWDLFAALPDRHTARQILNWNRYPTALRHACKLYTFALLNITEDAPRLRNARSPVPGVKTIVADLGYLHLFVTWLAGRGIDRFTDVTGADLDAYRQHITDATTTSHWKRKALLAVLRLHAYRDHLPPRCRLPALLAWGGVSAAELADDPAPRLGENRTPRIHPDVMQPLLSAALLVVDTVAADLIPAAKRLITMRQLAHDIAPADRRRNLHGTARRAALIQHLDNLLGALAATGHPLPGRRHERHVLLDMDAIAVGGWLDRTYLRKIPALRDALTGCGLPVSPDLLRVTRFSRVGTRPWRERPVETTELVDLLRHIATACFLIIAYLSGVRTGEALNLRRGCITHDRKLGLTFMSGQQMKAGPDRRQRSPQTIPWVVTEHTAHAVALLEDLAVGSMIFPRGRFCTQEWFEHASSRSRTPGRISGDIAAFVAWFNTDLAPATGHPTVGKDPSGAIIGPRLRLTLAWHIVRRPGGTIAGATQYGHLRTQLISGYAGHAGSGFLDELSFEEFLHRAETLHEDHQRLTSGEHVSGPAADDYRHRVAAAGRFAGLTITTAAQADQALTSPHLNIHHGALLTCVYRPQTAACRQSDDHGGGPTWSRCRLTCCNIARTDHDIANLQRHVEQLKADLAGEGLPQPLRLRIQLRLDDHERVIAEHNAQRSGAAGETAPRSAP